ncbi:carbohydrate deacetylase [Candidatus Enterococcus mangumiae]|uniref:Chitin disaccharide deacetylase n=1 Tax=Candidatus Enterococcus mangumiae TaxID=2230878 RepID=A0ABZ2SVS7_9ENTE|nr:carbohydrate deacetylase [Enterococcus sp. DIV1094]MBO0489326.1 carbohydrate deacetylase [Enterococcus sp. DIV1094]
MKKIIINADDFGYSPAVNLGIIEAFQNGVLTSTTLMANMPGSDEAIQLAKKHAGLGVGGHLVLTCGKPMLSSNSLIDEQGNFFNLNEYQEKRNEMEDAEIFEEWCAQIDYLLNNGVNLTHLDSHHHVHTFRENYEITTKIAEKYQLCFRNAFGLEEQLALPCQKAITGFLDLMDHQEIRNLDATFASRKKECLAEIQGVLNQVEEGQVTELMVHPAYVDEILYFHSSFNVQRVKEVAILCSTELKQVLETQDFTMYHYGNIQS